MVIASRPKQPRSTHHKKRTGQHHRQTKQFAKTYWPYLPMIVIASAVNAGMGDQSPMIEASLASTTRVEAWTDLGAWSAVVAISLVTAAFLLFLSRHALVWHRILVKGEAITKHNHMLDLILASVVLAGFVVTRSV